MRSNLTTFLLSLRILVTHNEFTRRLHYKRITISSPVPFIKSETIRVPFFVYYKLVKFES